MHVINSIVKNRVLFVTLFVVFLGVSIFGILMMKDVYEYNIVFETGQDVTLGSNRESGSRMVTSPLVQATELGELIRIFHKRSNDYQGIRILVPRDSNKYLTVVAQAPSLEEAKSRLENLLAQISKSFEKKIKESRLQIELHREKFKADLVNQTKGLKSDPRPNYELVIMADRSSFMVSSLEQALEIPLLRNISVFDGFPTSEKAIGPNRLLLGIIGFILSLFFATSLVVLLQEFRKEV